MKTKKLLGILLAVALLAVAVVPFTASAAGDAISILNTSNTANVVNNMGETEENCAISFDNNAVLTLTVGPSSAGAETGAQAYMTSAHLSTSAIILTDTPMLYYDVSGANWDFWIRFEQGDNGLIKLSTLLGVDKMEAGSGSVNLADVLPKSDSVSFSGDVLNISVVKWVAYGDEGDSVTFNKLYFAGEGQSDVSVDTGSAAPAASETASTASKASTGTTSKAASTASKASTSSSSTVKTGESVLPIVAVAALAAVAGSAVVISKKRG